MEMTWRQKPLEVQAVQYAKGVTLPPPMVKMKEEHVAKLKTDWCLAKIDERIYLIGAGQWVVVYNDRTADIMDPEHFEARFTR